MSMSTTVVQIRFLPSTVLLPLLSSTHRAAYDTDVWEPVLCPFASWVSKSTHRAWLHACLHRAHGCAAPLTVLQPPGRTHFCWWDFIHGWASTEAKGSHGTHNVNGSLPACLPGSSLLLQMWGCCTACAGLGGGKTEVKLLAVCWDCLKYAVILKLWFQTT